MNSYQEISPGIMQCDGNLWIVKELNKVIQENELLGQVQSIPAHGADIKHVQQWPKHKGQEPDQGRGHQKKEVHPPPPCIASTVYPRWKRSFLFDRDQRIGGGIGFLRENRGTVILLPVPQSWKRRKEVT